MITNLASLKDHIKNRSGGDPNKAQVFIRTYAMESMWNRFVQNSFFVHDLAWGEVNEAIQALVSKMVRS